MFEKRFQGDQQNFGDSHTAASPAVRESGLKGKGSKKPYTEKARIKREDIKAEPDDPAYDYYLYHYPEFKPWLDNIQRRLRNKGLSGMSDLHPDVLFKFQFILADALAERALKRGEDLKLDDIRRPGIVSEKFIESQRRENSRRFWEEENRKEELERRQREEARRRAELFDADGERIPWETRPQGDPQIIPGYHRVLMYVASGQIPPDAFTLKKDDA